MKDILEISHIEKDYRIDKKNVAVLRDINLRVRDGEFVSIVGASGCGKSTLLKIIVGLETASGGEVLLDGRPVREPSAECGIVFQEPRLFPWSNVRQNIDFGIPETIGGMERKKRLDAYVCLVGLEAFVAAKPNQLSGGMQQRVSIARALAGEPELLLLDEPFGALDALTRIQMQQEILRIWESEKRTMVLVTHDIDEAIYLGDRVIVMSRRPGTIKRTIPIEAPRPRDRNSDSFSRIRREIFQEFFDEPGQKNPEYYL
ncbi:MAG: ABC transporter ATP-binding protein [Treponema sp.]|jgi:sulfonate transport system ATP-binding protein|nr:ABC transporter ATP-binding protein [Treponema sp.]